MSEMSISANFIESHTRDDKDQLNVDTKPVNKKGRSKSGGVMTLQHIEDGVVQQ